MQRKLNPLSFIVPLLLAAAPLLAQEERSAAHVYEAYYRVAYGDVDEWGRNYRTYMIPALRDLQDEGVIEGWSGWQHHTGGTYNIRLAVRLYDWPSIATFWDAYIARLEAAIPANELTAAQRLVIQHRDEIWDIGRVDVPPDLDLTHAYTASYGVNFADVDEWNSLWNDVLPKFMQAAAEDGLQVGWVRLDHNTGGALNTKHIFLFDSWDAIETFIFERVLATLRTEQPAVWERANALIRDHDDTIWVPIAEE